MDNIKKPTSHQKFYRISLQKTIKKEPIDYKDFEDVSNYDTSFNLEENIPSTSKFSWENCDKENNFKESNWENENIFCETISFQEKKEKYSQKLCNKKSASYTFDNGDGSICGSESSSSKNLLLMKNQSDKETGTSSQNYEANSVDFSLLEDLTSVLSDQSQQMQQHFKSECKEGSSSGLNLISSINLGTHGRLKCKFCTHFSKNENNLYEHMMSHINMTCYTCPKCSYVTKRKSNLSQHAKKHSEERPYKCDFCPFAAKLPFVLRRHLRIHNSNRPVDQCPYSSKFDYAVKQESSIPYRCGKCSFSSKIKREVIEHMRCHYVQNVGI